jgi:adenylosuccinate lyase
MTEKRRKGGAEGFGFDTYLSPFTWRYGSSEMRSLFSEVERRATWRRAWLALAEGERRFGLVSRQELEGIRSKSGREHVDVNTAQELEKKIRHDLMAELRTFADQAKVGGGKLHLGATSSDVEDNADMASYQKALDLVLARLGACLAEARRKIIEYKGTICMAWTHLQPAEPTTLGYRFANYAQDLVLDVKLIEAVRGLLRGKGVKGAVGTSASFKALLGSDARARELEGVVMERLGVAPVDVATQTYPRKLDYLLLLALASTAQSCHKFGLDLRVMQSPAFGELSEPIKDLQVGSSAMPFKRNPVLAERMCSLARFVAALPPVGFTNAANSILERTLDDSAARRIVMPEAFLAVDECLAIYRELMSGMRVHPAMLRKNLERYGPFAGTEAVLMKVVEKGGDRQKAHEAIRTRSFAAWEEVMRGRPNPIERMLASDKVIASKIGPTELKRLMDPRAHVGDAESRCEHFVKDQVDPLVAKYAQGKGVASPRF